MKRLIHSKQLCLFKVPTTFLSLSPEPKAQVAMRTLPLWFPPVRALLKWVLLTWTSVASIWHHRALQSRKKKSINSLIHNQSTSIISLISNHWPPSSSLILSGDRNNSNRSDSPGEMPHSLCWKRCPCNLNLISHPTCFHFWRPLL